jgi:Putative peptidoglycan binding domain
MSVLKKGSIGPEVKGIQLRLNTRLTPSPKLSVDGHFGPKTEAAVIRFQRETRLSPDGVVGPKTSAALAALPKSPPPPNLSKFVAELGTLDDLVQHVRVLEAMNASPSAVMNGVADFFGTAGRKRYLLVQSDKVGVIDFRHFFAAATESYNSNQSMTKFGVRIGGSPGQAVLLGVGNEVGQCVGEGIASKLNSCFAAEDLGSNRLGAGFGELLKVREAERRAPKINQLLREYIAKYQPLPPEKINLIKTAGRWDVALEALAGIVAGVGDILIPRAY